MDGFIFKDLKNLDYAVLAPSLWHQHFKLFELEEIMHQRDSKLFAELLNRLLEGVNTQLVTLQNSKRGLYKKT